MFGVTKNMPLYRSNAEMVNVWPQAHGSNKLTIHEGSMFAQDPITQRGVAQPHPSTDGLGNPGRPTHENGRKRHRHGGHGATNPAPADNGNYGNGKRDKTG